MTRFGQGWMRRTWLVTGVVLGGLLLTALSMAGPLTDKGTQPPLNFPLQPSLNCAACHAGYDALNNIEPNNTWSGSMMAQASRDPLFWAALDVANNDIPGVGDFCLRCHVPIGWLEGRAEPPGGSTDGCSMVGKIDELNNDFDGIGCHQCHRMMVNPAPPAGEEAVYYDNAQFWLDDKQCNGFGEPCRRGPYDYAVPPSAPHAWAYSSYHEDSDLCANCHNVTHPTKNLIDNGVDQGIPFPIERTFREWEQSDYAPGGPDFQTCQNCHMPDADADPVYGSSFALHNRTGDLPIHQFAGGNAWVPEVLRNEYPNLGLGTALAATRDWALDMLQNKSALVETFVPAEVASGEVLDVQVRVTNLTGHKLPTGYPEGRRMWINVEARDGADTKFWESGAYDAASAVLTEDTQIKIYHAEPGIWDYNGTSECDIVDGVGNPMFHFVLNDCWKVDNRIPPKGFTGASNLETRPVGYSYPETSPGSGVSQHWDTTDYAIAVPPGTTGPITLTATLLYQTMSKDYVEFLLRESDTHNFPDDCIERTGGFPNQTRAEILYDMWNTYGKAAPVAMGSAMGQIAIQTATPGEASAAANPMLITSYDRTLGDIGLSYEPACAASDHTIYYGNLTDVATLTFSGQICGIGDTGSASFNPGTGDMFWLVVANDGAVEGSYGTNSLGERAEDDTLTSCSFPLDLTNRCD